MFKLFECSGINVYRYNLPARYGKRRERSADSGFDSVFSGRECCRSGGGAVRNTVSDGCRRAVAAAFAAGACAVASAAAIAVVLIPESSGIRFGGSFDFMVSCLGFG